MNTSAAEQMLTRARKAQRAWGGKRVSERCRYLRSLRREIAANSEMIASTIAREAGKLILDALSGDVLFTLEQLRYYERHASRILRAQRANKPWLFFRGTQFEVHMEAHGVALVFGASNYPFQLSMTPLITALAAGNAVVLKCSEHTPATAALIAQLCERAGLPSDLVQIVCTGPAESTVLIEARPDFIFFTGSSEHGRRVAELAAKLPVPCALELGGKDAAIVFRDCNLERAVEGITYGAFSNSGRVCVAVKRVFVDAAICHPFLERLKARLNLLKASSDPDADLCPEAVGLSSLLKGQVEEALFRGATLEYPEQNRGIHAGPIVLSDVAENMAIMTEESFGPVLCVTPFRDEEEAIALAESTRFALSSSVWTRDRKRARRVAAQLSAGSCAVNDVIRVIANPHTPFGGNKASGYGRYHGAEGLRTFSRLKTVMFANDRRTREVNWFPFKSRTIRQLATVMRLRHGGGLLSRIALLFSIALIAAAPLAPAAQIKAETHLSIQIRLAPNANGELAYLIFDTPAGFPADRDKALRSGFVTISPGARDVQVDTDLRHGIYAVSVYEDRNGDHKLDRNLIGIPREPVGVSNNPRVRYGAPHFEECSFRLDTALQTISIIDVPRS